MPYTLKTQQISVKDPDSGEYIGVDVLTEQTKEGLIAELQAEGYAQVIRINQTGTNVQNLVNQEEARAQQIVTDAQTSLNTLETQKNTIAETVASMAELGTDTTLTTPGMAADAKATGDAIGTLNNTLNASINAQSENLEFVQGNIDSYGNNTSATNRIRTDYLFCPVGFAFTVPNGYKAYLRYYTSNTAASIFGNSGGWLTGDVSLFVSNANYIRIIVAKTDDSNLTPSDITTPVAIVLKQATDKTLTMKNVPADSKTVGDNLAELKKPLSDLEDESEYYNSVLDISEDDWYSGKRSFVYTTSTFSGFATNWTISSAKYVKSLKFAVNSRADTNITEIRVRIECGSFAIERSISVDIGSEQTVVTFPVEAIIPAGVVWVGIAANKIATYMFDDAIVQTGYEYWTNGDMSHLANLKNTGGSTHRLYLVAECYEKEVYIQDQFISQKKLSFAEEVIPENLVNIDDPEQCKKGWWYYSTNVGMPIALQDVSEHSYTGLTAETYGAEQIMVDCFPHEMYPPIVYWIGAADENMILLSYSIANAQVPITYTMPAGAKYVLISLQSKEDRILQKLMVVQGTEITEYVKGTGLRYKLNQCIIEDGESAKETVSLKLPASYDLVVGDTFQLFKKGIINAVNPDWFFVQFVCSKGNGFERMFELTPSVAETLSLQVTLFDQNHNAIDYGVVDLIVHSAPTSPENQTYVLCVGDSLTTSGSWPLELNRRLTGSGGSPAGDNLSNIEFIGTRDRAGTHYEGYGGWTFGSYNTANVDINAKVITCTHDKTEAADQHSIYKDANDAQWKLETIEVGQIKIIAISGAYGQFPSTGTLTWVSGGTNHSDIVYTASQNAPGNPFWNSTQNKVDFSWYCGQLGVPSIDYVYVLIGWNSASYSKETYMADAQTFINNVHTSYPNAKIVLIGLQLPSIDGIAQNYGAQGLYADYYYLMTYVNNVDSWYDELVENNSNVYHINLAGQFDTEYNMPTTPATVNSRNSTTVNRQSNGVHPAESGYMQIADAVYRFFAGLLGT